MNTSDELPLEDGRAADMKHPVAPKSDLRMTDDENRGTGMPFDPVDQLARAEAIASIAHRGQVDKLGDNYIQHPGRIAASLDDPLEKAAAWLHDVVEDTDITLDDLRNAGVDSDVVQIVVLMTRRDDVPSDLYYARLAEHLAARAVKLADIADNLLEGRVAQLDPAVRQRLAAKYAHARELLGGTECACTEPTSWTARSAPSSARPQATRSARPARSSSTTRETREWRRSAIDVLDRVSRT